MIIASFDPTVDCPEESSASLQNFRAPEVSYPQRQGKARTTLLCYVSVDGVHFLNSLSLCSSHTQRYSRVHLHISKLFVGCRSALQEQRLVHGEELDYCEHPNKKP